MGLVVDVIVAAVVLQIVSSVTDSLEVESWLAAFFGAVMLTLVDRLVTSILPVMPLVGWQIGAFMFLSNLAVLAVTSLVVPGLALRGVVGLVLAAALLTLANYLVPMIVSWTGLLSRAPVL
jgi:uncharacterized membrane protein YvlD (DUF360 family)